MNGISLNAPGRIETFTCGTGKGKACFGRAIDCKMFSVSSIIIYLAMKYRDLQKQLHDDGWLHIRTTGSHLHYKHPTKPGLVTVPSGGKLSHDM